MIPQRRPNGALAVVWAPFAQGDSAIRHLRRAASGDWASYLDLAMRSAGLSQAELARRSGLAESMVSRWLRGVNQPDVPNLRRIREVLGVSMLELLVAAGHLTQDEAQLEDTPEPPGPVRVGIATDGLTVEQIRQLEHFAAFLRAQTQNNVTEEMPVQPEPEPAEPLRYAAYGGAKLSAEQQSRVREQVRRARDQAQRTGSPVVYLGEDESRSDG